MTGAILVGGKSSRMGGDKTTMTVDGRRVLERSIGLLNEVCGSTVLVARDAQQASSFAALGCRLFEDRTGIAGPIAGLISALIHCNDDILLLGCDMPFVELELLKKIRATFDAKHPNALIARSPAPQPDLWQVEPLCGVWGIDGCRNWAIRVLFESQGRGLSLIGFSQLVQAEYLDLTPEESQQLRNINTPEDLSSGGNLRIPGLS